MEFLAHLALYTKVCEAPTYTHVFPYFEHGMIVFSSNISLLGGGNRNFNNLPLNQSSLGIDCAPWRRNDYLLKHLLPGRENGNSCEWFVHFYDSVNRLDDFIRYILFSFFHKSYSEEVGLDVLCSFSRHGKVNHDNKCVLTVGS